MKINKILLGFFLVLSFVLGWQIGLWLEHRALIFLTFEIPAVNILLSVCTTGLTLTVTIYVARIIQRATQNVNNQKQFFVSKIGEIDKLMAEIENIVSIDNFSYKLVLSKFMSLYFGLERLLSNLSQIYSFLSKEHRKKLLVLLLKIKNDATYTPFDNSRKDIVVVNDKVTYSASKRAEIVSLLADYRKELFNLQMDVFKG